MSKFSVIVPVYKVEKYIRKCIESILNQTYGDYELILVDDGSPDNCGIICDEYGKLDKRVKVIHKQNGGLSAARNDAVKIAKNQYIMFVDSDDYLELNALKVLNDVINKTKADIVCFNLNNVEDDTFKNLNDKFPFCYDNSNEIFNFNYSESLLDNISRKHIRYEAQSKVYKKSILNKIPFPEGMLAEDFATFYLFLKEAKNIVYVDSNLYNYVQRSGSIMNSRKPQLYKDIYITENKFYKEVSKNIVDLIGKKINETRRFRNLAKIYSKLKPNDGFEDVLLHVKSDIKKIDFNLLNGKYKFFYLVFLLNDVLFVKIFNVLYKKS